MLSIDFGSLARWAVNEHWHTTRDRATWAIRLIQASRRIRLMSVDFTKREISNCTLMTQAKKVTTPGRKTEAAFIYRGIKIPPIIGKRSPTALALRDALRTMYKHQRKKPMQPGSK